MGTVSLTTEEWQALIQARQDAEKRSADLAAEIVRLKADPGDELTARLIDGVSAAHELVQFLIAHAHPDVVKTQPWPHHALVRFAAVLEALPALPPQAEIGRASCRERV